MSKRSKIIIAIIVILIAIVIASSSFIINTIINSTIGKDLPKIDNNPEVGKWYSIDIDNAVSSDGSKWQGYFKKGSQNKVVLYFYGGGFSVNDYTAARSMDVEGGFYNPRINQGSNIMTYAIKNWGIGNNSEENILKDWTFIGVPYCNGDFHSGSNQKEYIALDGSKKTIYYEGFNNYQKLISKVLNYIPNKPDELLITGSSAGGFGAAILADNAIELFNNPQNVTVLVDSSLLINDEWHDIMVNEWKTPKELSDVVYSDNITLDSLVALHNKRENVKILFTCSVRDYNLAMAQKFFDEGSQNEMQLKISKAEGDRFQMLLKKMVSDMQEQIEGCGIYIWDEVTQKEGHITVHTAAGTKIFFDDKSRNPSLAKWLENAINGNVESFGLELLNIEY